MGGSYRHLVRPIPKDRGQEPQKTIKAARLGKNYVQELRNIQEDGTSTVTSKSIKVGVSKTIQGSRGGAWLVDTAEHLTSMAIKADQAMQELTAHLYTDLASAQEEIQAGRKSDQCSQREPWGIFPITKMWKEATQKPWQ